MSSILTYNGGALVAMTGRNCVAIASDRRYGIQNQTISTSNDKIYEIHPHLFIGMSGLTTDVQTMYDLMRFRCNMYELKENRVVAPSVFGRMVSNALYEQRFSPFFVETVIAGLNTKTKQAYVSNMDLIGCPNITQDFAVAGTCTSQLYGMCESLWEPDLEAEDLFETVSQALTNAVDRDAISGWGAVVYILEEEKLTKKILKTRMD